MMIIQTIFLEKGNQTVLQLFRQLIMSTRLSPLYISIILYITTIASVRKVTLSILFSISPFSNITYCLVEKRLKSVVTSFLLPLIPLPNIRFQVVEALFDQVKKRRVKGEVFKGNAGSVTKLLNPLTSIDRVVVYNQDIADSGLRIIVW